ncbi:MAG TPA: beta-propeller domain-containing protein, partial [Verrucomicrobiae bacterium]
MNVKNRSQIFRALALVVAVALFGSGPADAGNSSPRPRLQPQRVTSYAQLWRLLNTHQPRYFASYRTGLGAVTMNTPIAMTAAGANQATSYSTTLTQVTGVDEGDIVKTDGNLICQINQDRILILQAAPTPTTAAILDFTDGSFFPQELYLDNNQLVVLGTVFQSASGGGGGMMPLYVFSTGTVVAKIYDVSNPTQPAKVRELELDGDYVASRKIGSCLYFVARQYPNYYAQGTPIVHGPMTPASAM